MSSNRLVLMIWENINTITIIVGLIVSTMGMLIAGTWRLSSSVNELKIAIALARDEIEAKQDSQMREIGETISAVRQKIHEIEIWSRDTFIRRDSFFQVTTDTRQAIQTLGDRLEKRLERIENKVNNGHHKE